MRKIGNELNELQDVRSKKVREYAMNNNSTNTIPKKGKRHAF